MGAQLGKTVEDLFADRACEFALSQLGRLLFKEVFNF